MTTTVSDVGVPARTGVGRLPPPTRCAGPTTRRSTPMTTPHPDAGVRAQDAAEAHLAACDAAEEAMDEALMAGEPIGELDSPACGPYDGCTTCMVRETLFAAWPV